jgi:hypothetical protein
MKSKRPPRGFCSWAAAQHLWDGTLAQHNRNPPFSELCNCASTRLAGSLARTLWCLC